jgi:hypothetical protein
MTGKHYAILFGVFAAGWIINNLAFGQSAFTISPSTSTPVSSQ